MKLRFHYIREKLQDGTTRVAYLETGKMVADMMTKALGRVLFERFRRILIDGNDNEGNSLGTDGGVSYIVHKIMNNTHIYSS
jgi:hypothetical protein